jgi:hypothetical protein
MNDALLDRIKAHRSAPDVYDPPTFDQMADRILELEDKLAIAGEAIVNDTLELATCGRRVSDRLAKLKRENL